MLFLLLSNADIEFAETKGSTQRNYTAATAFSMTKRLHVIDEREFAAAALNKKIKSLIVHVANLLTTLIYPKKKAQI